MAVRILLKRLPICPDGVRRKKRRNSTSSTCITKSAVGKISDEAQRLIDTTRESLYVGLKQAVAGNRIGDISNAVQVYCEERGYGVVRDFVGHGIGRELHEDPSVPNFRTPGRGARLMPGMTIAVEPMINQGVPDVKQLSDKWTVVTKDGKLSAHYEHTIAITKDEPLILTSQS